MNVLAREHLALWRRPIAILAILLCQGKPATGDVTQVPAEAIRQWRPYRDYHVKLLRLRGKDFDGADLELTYKCSGNNRVVMMEARRGPTWTGTAWGRNGEYWFKISRRGRDQPWILTSLVLRSRSGDPSHIDSVLNAYDGDCRNYAIALFRYPIDELVRLKSFRVVATTSDEMRPSIRWFRFTVDPDEKVGIGDTAFFHGGRFALDSARAWLPVEAELDCPHDQARVMRSDFRQEPESGRWFAGREDLVTKRLSTGNEARCYNVVVDLSTTSAPSPAEFFLAHFGLPEPPTPSSRLATYFWMAAIGLMLVVTGVLLRRWRSAGGIR